MKKHLRKQLLFIGLLLCATVACLALLLASNLLSVAFAYEDNHAYCDICECNTNEHDLCSCCVYNLEQHNCCTIEQSVIGFEPHQMPPLIGMQDYEGTGCGGCIFTGASCGPGRELGFSANYLTAGCRNWQLMPLFNPLNRFWIDEATLNVLTANQRIQFIRMVEDAAAIWNSTYMHDGTGRIINLTRVFSNGSRIVPIRLNPNLDVAGRFHPNPIAPRMYIRSYNYFTTMKHEFGHMLGLQDLDMRIFGDNVNEHQVLMGYGQNSSVLHYQDIQGAAVANTNHTHNFKRHVRQEINFLNRNSRYFHICFYCDVIYVSWSPLQGSQHLVYAATCNHNFKKMVSAGDRHWQKCVDCYKVVESEFFIRGINNGTEIEITGLINTHAINLNIPNEIGGLPVTRIVANAFMNTPNLQQITVASTNQHFFSQDGVLYNHARTQFIHIPTDLRGWLSGFVRIPSGITSIPAFAFANRIHINSVVISDTVTSIGTSAFENALNLERVTFAVGSNLFSIGSYAFYGTAITNIPLPSSVGTIGTNAFPPNAIVTWTNNFIFQGTTLIGFVGSTTLTTYSVPSFITRIGAGAFVGSNLATVRLPNTITYIADCAFDESTVLVWNNQFEFVGDTLTRFLVSGWEVIVPSRVANKPIRHIANNAFQNRNNIHNIILSEGIITIGDNAFRGARDLGSIIIPSSIISIGEGAFYLTRLWTATPADQPVRAGNWIVGFRSNSPQNITNLPLTRTIRGIADGALSGLTSLQSIILSNNVLHIGTNALPNQVTVYAEHQNRPDNWNVDNITSNRVVFLAELRTNSIASFDLFVASIPAAYINSQLANPHRTNQGLTHFSFSHWDFAVNGRRDAIWLEYTPNSPDDVFWVDCLETMLLYMQRPNATILNDFTLIISSSTTHIMPYEFMGMPIRAVLIPSSVEYIGQGAFANTSLRAIIFGEGYLGDRLLYIGEGAFANTTYLLGITIPASVEWIGEGAFNGSAVRNIYIRGQYTDFGALGGLSDATTLQVQSEEQYWVARGFMESHQIVFSNNPIRYVLVVDGCMDWSSVAEWSSTLRAIMESYIFWQVVTFDEMMNFLFVSGKGMVTDRFIFFVSSKESLDTVTDLIEQLPCCLENVVIYIDFFDGSYQDSLYSNDIFMFRQPLFHTGVQKALSFLYSISENGCFAPRNDKARFIIEYNPFIYYGIKHIMQRYGWCYGNNFEIVQKFNLDMQILASFNGGDYWWNISSCCDYNHHTIFVGITNPDIISLIIQPWYHQNYLHFLVSYMAIANHHFIANMLMQKDLGLLCIGDKQVFIKYCECCNINQYFTGFFNQTKLIHFRLGGDN